MSTGGPLVCLFGPYFFQNEYSKPLPGPKFEYWPFETIPLNFIMRVCVNLCWVVIPALEVPFIHHFTIVNTAEFNVITMEVNKHLTKV